MAPAQQKFAQDTVVNFAYISKRASEAPDALPVRYVERFLDGLKSAEVRDELSPYVGPTLDLEKVAQALGSSILRRTE
jgi:hypothetical protein